MFYLIHFIGTSLLFLPISTTPVSFFWLLYMGYDFKSIGSPVLKFNISPHIEWPVFKVCQIRQSLHADTNLCFVAKHCLSTGLPGKNCLAALFNFFILSSASNMTMGSVIESMKESIPPCFSENINDMLRFLLVFIVKHKCKWFAKMTFVNKVSLNVYNFYSLHLYH